MRRRLKITALVIGSLVLLVIAFVAWVISTEAGLRFAVARVPERIGKVTLKIEEVRGTIVGGFGARRVDVDHELTRTVVENGSARVNAWPLLVGRIAVRDASTARASSVTSRSASSTAASSTACCAAEPSASCAPRIRSSCAVTRPCIW
jgi:autotransporter translocation and assembly factor TamB